MTIPQEHIDNFPKLISDKGLSSDVSFQKLENNKIKFSISNLQSDKLIEAIDFVRSELCADSKIEINSDLTFNERSFDREINLSNCIFNNKFLFRKCIFKKNVWFKSTQFLSTTSFKGSFFERKVRFHFSEFNTSVIFENTVFKDLADFYYANFYETQQFHLTDFLSVTIFSNVTFHKQAQFLYNKVSFQSIISFESAAFNQSLDISRANFWCKLSFWNVEIEKFPLEMWLYQTDDIRPKKLDSFDEARKRIRESYRIIKNEFTKEGNSIESLQYYSYEMGMYEKEIENEKKIENRLLVWLNKKSNNFGTSWKNGIVFTLLTTLLFYLLFLLTFSPDLYFECSWEAFSMTIKHFFEFLNVAKWDIKPFGIENYSWGYIVLFIGRLFIAYGYYQTVQAFRKYGRK